MKLLDSLKINYVTQKTFSDLKDILPLRYDFYLPDYNIIIEHHGEEHFGKGRYYTKNLIKHDKQRYKYAVDHNIHILYFTIYKYEYNKYGYFTNVITNIEDLINEIKNWND